MSPLHVCQRKDVFVPCWLFTALSLEITHDISFRAQREAGFPPSALKGRQPAGAPLWQGPCRVRLAGVSLSELLQMQPGNEREAGGGGALRRPPGP